MSIVKLSNNGVKNATAFGSITGLGSMIFIKKLTASSSATLSFVDGSNGVVLDNTYKEYLFTFNNVHPASNRPGFEFNMSADSGSNYNVTKTTTFFRASQGEGAESPTLGYVTGDDQAQQTANARISPATSNNNDSGLSGYLHLFNPSSTTFIKHFISCNNVMYEDGSGTNYSFQSFVAGYGNTTSAVDAVQFNYASGNIDAGDICLYGIA